MTTETRVIPHHLEAERAVLGAVMIDNRVWPVARGIVSSHDFFRLTHRWVFEAIEAVAQRNEPMELLTVRVELERRGRLEEVGAADLYALIDGVPWSTNVEYYAKVVKEKATLRQLIDAAQRILVRSYEAEQSLDDVIDASEADIMRIGSARIVGDFVLPDRWMDEVRGIVQDAQHTRRVVTGVPTGLSLLDTYTRGFQASDLVFIGARPSTGKTSLALQLALAAAETVMVGFVSIEMPRRSIGIRAVSMESRVDAHRIMTGHVAPHEVTRINAAIARLEATRIAIDDSSSQTPAQLRAKVRRFTSRYGCGICFIDYMQLLRDEQGRAKENRNQELSAISAALKSLARELNIPIVVLSQLSRDSEKRGASRRPQLWDLRDSGSLEADADLVMLLHRPNQHDEEPKQYADGEEAQLIVAKHRNGPTGTIKLRWLASTMRFAEMETHRAEPEQPAMGYPR